MADGTGKHEIAVEEVRQLDRGSELSVPADEEHRRQIREWKNKLSEESGWKGKVLRRAFASEWC